MSRSVLATFLVPSALLLCACTSPVDRPSSQTETPSTSVTKSSSTPDRSSEKPRSAIKPRGQVQLDPPISPDFRSIDTTKKVVALTFDDGPGPYTPQILKVLKEKKVPGTFFVVGREVKSNQQIFKALVDSGMGIQSHTYSHRPLNTLSSQEIKDELLRTEKAMVDSGAPRPLCVRAPYMARSKESSRIARQEGYTEVLWNSDSNDWQKPGVKTIMKSSLATLTGRGDIILMHDGGGDRSQTLKTLPGLIETLKDRGYSFVSLCNEH